MKELSEKEKAYAALDELASDSALTDEQRNTLCDDVQYYIYSLELQLRILG